MLHTRKDRVLIVQRPSSLSSAPSADGAALGSAASTGGVEVIEVLRSTNEPHIEKQLVGSVVALHAQFQQQLQQQR